MQISDAHMWARCLSSSWLHTHALLARMPNMRITGGNVSTQNPFGPNWARGTQEASTVGKQVQDNLFGKPKPKVLDQDDVDTARQMGMMHVYRKKLARLAGDDPDEYSLLLADGTIAMIDQQ